MYPHDRLLAATLLRFIPWSVPPNAMTGVRFLLTPFVIYFLAVGNFSVAVPLFIIAALTDALDGSMARTRNQITVWGTTYDPVADKLLIGSVIVYLIVKHVYLPIGVAIITLETVFLVGGYLERCRGRICEPSWWGKMKMLFQVVGITLLLFGAWFSVPMLINGAAAVLMLSIGLGFAGLVRYGIRKA